MNWTQIPNVHVTLRGNELNFRREWWFFVANYKILVKFSGVLSSYLLVFPRKTGNRLTIVEYKMRYSGWIFESNEIVFRMTLKYVNVQECSKCWLVKANGSSIDLNTFCHLLCLPNSKRWVWNQPLKIALMMGKSLKSKMAGHTKLYILSFFNFRPPLKPRNKSIFASSRYVL